MLEKTKAFFKVKGSIKYKIALIVIFILFMDIGYSINNSFHEKFDEYESQIAVAQIAINEYKENEKLYQETLFFIAKELYDREAFMTGGVEIPSEISIEILLEAIKNTAEDFSDVLSATENYFHGRNELMSTIPSIWPLEHSIMARVTSNYGYRISPISGRVIFHRGLDITGGEINIKYNKYTAPKVIATADGRIKTHYLPPGWYNGKYYKGYIDEDGDDFGAYVIIEHGFFDKENNFVNNGYETVYAHMIETQKYVKEGEFVHQGDPIGEMGSTGNSTGIHVHYEIKKNGENVDPADYLISMLGVDGKEVKLNKKIDIPVDLKE